MAYAPRKHNYRIKWKIALPLLLLVVLVVYASVSLLTKKQEDKVKFTVCGFTPEKTATVLNKKSADIYTVSDYVLYGESLGLFEQSYSPLNTNALSGKSMIVHNVCDDSETTITLENTADQKIQLGNLKPGFYEMSVIDNLVKKRLVFAEPLEENHFATARRNGTATDVSLVANQELLKDQQITLDQNYLYLQVEEQQPADDVIDVLLDPYGMNIDLTTAPDKGAQGNGLIENDEMYAAAELMKQELESYGLRVEITKKNADEVIASYGKDGRYAKGYEKQAKYYISMRFSSSASDANASGIEISHSAYSSPNLARGIMYRMQKDQIVTPSKLYYDDYNWPGVTSSNMIKGLLDSQSIYDMNMQLRESGGRATLAGKFSETSKKQNGVFSESNGMQGVEIYFAYLTNAQDAQNWKDRKEEIMKSCAKAFVYSTKIVNE